MKKRTDKVIILGKMNNSQDGVIVDGGGISPCLTSGHGNCPKIVEYEENRQDNN